MEMVYTRHSIVSTKVVEPEAKSWQVLYVMSEFPCLRYLLALLGMILYVYIIKEL